MCECANVFEILPGWALKLTYNIIFHNSPCNLSPRTSQHFSIVFIDDSSTLTLCHPLGKALQALQHISIVLVWVEIMISPFVDWRFA